ncbi:MAG: flavin reductase, partial [Gammaproteobacteria bacterium]|nr:flavin reductase [Gammaproteobacteria bacterium]
YAALEALDVASPIWDRFFTIAPLVLVGSIEEDGRADFAPKHMAFPLGWDNYFGFVCTPRHGTYANVKRVGAFTVTYPKPADIVMTSLAAAPRCDDEKPIISLTDTFPAQRVVGEFVSSGYLFLECELVQIVDGFDANSLIAGRVVAAYAQPEALRRNDRDDAEI